MTVQTGQEAPDFSLYNTEKVKIHLRELRGSNVVLLFFPLAFTSVCTTELCHMRDTMSFYNQVNARVLGISVDSLYTLGRFKQTEALNFDLLSDFNKEVSQAYGSLYETFGYDMRGVSKRSAFVIDKDGMVQYAEVLENAGLEPDFKKIEDALRNLNR